MGSVTVELEEGMKISKNDNERIVYQLIKSSASGKMYVYCPYISGGVELFDDFNIDGFSCCDVSRFSDIKEYYKVDFGFGSMKMIIEKEDLISEIENNFDNDECEPNIKNVNIRVDEFPKNKDYINNLRDKIEDFYNKLKETK